VGKSGRSPAAPRLRSGQAAAALIGVAAFVFRYLTSGAIENDHFIMLARAYQVLIGDWPVRDFEDPGQPLAYLVSTAAAAMFGPTLLVNIVLCILFFCATAAITYLLVLRATGSTVAGIAAATITTVFYPRMYNTTKVIVPVVAIWLAWRYADVPGTRRLAALAAWTAIAFLLRHDYIAYVAVSSTVLLMMCHADALRDASRRLVAYAGLSLLFISPWLLYVQWYEGVPEYFASALRFVAAEGRRTAGGSPPALFYALVAIPVVGLLLSWREGPRLSRAQLASASALVLVIDVVFLRDVLAARLPDVVAPIAVVTAAVAGHLFPPRAVSRAAIAALAAAMLFAVAPVAARSGAIPTPLELPRQAMRVTRRLEYASPEIQPNPSLAPLIAYLTRCTRPLDRVLVSGFGPEIPVLAHRPFAGGLPAWIPGYYDDPVDVGRAIARLRREQVGAAIMLDGSDVLTNSWPDLGRWVREREFEEHAVPSVDSRIRVWLPRVAPSTPTDIPTGLPCRSG
jgi:hypothetical protein